MKIVITLNRFTQFGQKEIKRFEEQGCEVIAKNTEGRWNRDELLERCRDADAIIAGMEDYDAGFLSECRNLKIICRFGVGIDNVDVDYCKAHGIIAERTPGSNSRSVAESVITFIMADSNNFLQNIETVKKGGWNAPATREVEGATLGIIGFGNIGKQVYRMAKGLDMNVIVYNRSTIDFEDVRNADLEFLLSNSDYVSINCSYTPETKYLINEKTLSLMKPDACLINTARAWIVNEDDLCNALKNGVIRSCYSDVFWSEPVSGEHEILALDNFHLTPHAAARGTKAQIKSTQMAADTVFEYLKEYENSHN